MVATNSLLPRTGNVSVGTSIFAMVVLERPLQRIHREIDLVTTPDGTEVGMVHCNNGASELAAWAGMFQHFAKNAGLSIDSDTAYDILLRAALEGASDADGILAYNQLAGEPLAGLEDGRPVLARSPTSR